MANSKLIIVEGPQGVGKTTVTDYLRDTLKGTNLYRLSGTNDSSVEGKSKASNMYKNLNIYIKSLENNSINLIFDRTFFSEENYCRLGKKDYSFTDVYEGLLADLASFDFDIYYVNLFLGQSDEFAKRLQREGKVQVSYASFSIENSLKQQEIYLEMAKEIEDQYPHIKVLNYDNSQDVKIMKKELREFLEY